MASPYDAAVHAGLRGAPGLYVAAFDKLLEQAGGFRWREPCQLGHVALAKHVPAERREHRALVVAQRQAVAPDSAGFACKASARRTFLAAFPVYV